MVYLIRLEWCELFPNEKFGVRKLTTDKMKGRMIR